MLIVGIILTALGLFVFQWSVNALNKSFFERPLIFNSAVAVLIINLIWIGLVGGGFYFLWQVNSKIVLSILGIYAILWIFGYFMGSEKVRAKKIFKIYKQLRLFRPRAKEEEILEETARIYFKGLRWEDDKIQHLLDILSIEKTGNKVKDIKELVNYIFTFENPRDDFGINFNIESFVKQSEKREKAIEQAHKAVFEEKIEIKERPVLSEEALQRMGQLGLDPEEMSNEQLAAFESLEKPQKSHWIAKPFIYIGFGLEFLAILSLIYREWQSFVMYGLIGLVLAYVGYRIQSGISSKKFYEASIRKYAEEQKKKNE